MAENAINHDVTDHYAQISLEDEEESGLVIEKDSEELLTNGTQWCLVGRFLTNKHINFKAMKNTIAALWQPVKGVCINELSQSVFMFQFFHELAVQLVVNNKPWTFDKHLLIIKRVMAGEQPLQVPLFHLSFWVQIYDLPVGFMTERICKSVGDYIGEYTESDPNNFGGMWKTYMRIRVQCDVRIPIKMRMKIKREGGEWVWINFKHERLVSSVVLLVTRDWFCEKLYYHLKDKIEYAYGTWI